jgi:hypothetical protein
MMRYKVAVTVTSSETYLMEVDAPSEDVAEALALQVDTTLLDSADYRLEGLPEGVREAYRGDSTGEQAVAWAVPLGDVPPAEPLAEAHSAGGA